MSTEASTEDAAPVSWKRRFSGLTIFFAVFLFCVTAEIEIENVLRGDSFTSPVVGFATVAITFLFGLFMLGIFVFVTAVLPALLLLFIFFARGAPSLVECLLAGIATGIIFTKLQADFSDIYFKMSDALLYSSMGVVSGLAAWLFWRRSPLSVVRPADA